MAAALVRLYEQMPAPKYVIALGACTITGRMFSADSPTVVRGVDKLIRWMFICPVVLQDRKRLLMPSSNFVKKLLMSRCKSDALLSKLTATTLLQRHAQNEASIAN